MADQQKPSEALAEYILYFGDERGVRIFDDRNTGLNVRASDTMVDVHLTEAAFPDRPPTFGTITLFGLDAQRIGVAILHAERAVVNDAFRPEIQLAVQPHNSRTDVQITITDRTGDAPIITDFRTGYADRRDAVGTAIAERGFAIERIRGLTLDAAGKTDEAFRRITNAERLSDPKARKLVRTAVMERGPLTDVETRLGLVSRMNELAPLVPDAKRLLDSREGVEPHEVLPAVRIVNDWSSYWNRAKPMFTIPEIKHDLDVKLVEAGLWLDQHRDPQSCTPQERIERADEINAAHLTLSALTRLEYAGHSLLRFDVPIALDRIRNDADLIAALAQRDVQEVDRRIEQSRAERSLSLGR